MADCVLEVKVHPNRSPTRFRGERGGRLAFDVGAPPDKGKANDELVRFLAKALGLRREDVEIVSGHASPQKRVRVRGGDAEWIVAVLAGGK